MGTQRRPGPSGSSPIRKRGNTRRGRNAEEGDLRIVSVEATPVWKKPPVMIGAGAGALLLLIIIIAASTGGSTRRSQPMAEAPDIRRAKPAAPRPVPNVSHLEAKGRAKCQEGANIVRPRLQVASSASALDDLRRDLERGLKPLYEGLSAYREATELAGKSYPISEFEKLHARGVKILCTDYLEKEGQAKLEEGMSLIQAREAQMKGGGTLPAAQQSALRADLERGVTLIRAGMNLFDRSYQVSGHTFEVKAYSKAQKAARMKILELKP